MTVTKWAGKIIHRSASEEETEPYRMLDALGEAGSLVISFNDDGGVHYRSPGLEKRLGRRPSDRDDFIASLGSAEPNQEQIRRFLEGDDPGTTLRVQIAPKGTPLSVTGVTVPGMPHRRMLVMQELPQESAVRGQIERLERLATVGQIAAGAVHEFNNNLTSILGWAQIAEQNLDPDSSAASAVGIIADNARKAKRIFSKLLNMSKASSDDEPYEAALPESVADDALGMLHFEMKSRNIALNRKYENVGTCDIDEDRLSQVFINLIKNALEAMDADGELTVSIKKDSKNARISFQDTGPGMPPETAARVFDSFFTTKKQDESALNGGTGLGLAISLEIVRQHGGDIELTTEVGAGACFTVVLPLQADAPRTERPSASSRPTIPPGAVVLVVDDEPDIGEMVRMSLELKGVSVLSVQNGDDALAQLKRIHFDAAFVDYSMPGIAGHELGRKIKEVDAELPVIFMSGLTVEIDEVIGDFIKKPFDLDEIQAKLYDVLKRKKELAIQR